MVVYYASLVAAILFGMGGQITLKSGAEDYSATVAAQFTNPVTILGFSIPVSVSYTHLTLPTIYSV